MASIRLGELYDRAGMIRSDLLQDQIASALVDSARKLAIDTGLLEDEIPFTLFAGEWDMRFILPAGRQVQQVKRVEVLDREDGRWSPLRGPDLRILGAVPPESRDAGTPTSWITKGDDRVLFDCPAEEDMALRVTLAYIPAKGETPDEIAFPVEAEEALVHLAKSKLWGIAGRGQNLRSEAVEARDYRAQLPKLCHLADVGHMAVRVSVNDSLPKE